VSNSLKGLTQLGLAVSLLIGAGAIAQDEESPPPVEEYRGQASPAEVPPPAEEPVPEAAQPRPGELLLDGHVRQDGFFSSPGSVTFILHHTVMGAAAGLATQGIAHRFNLSNQARQGMLIGTLVGAGVGFGSSAWWQSQHWVGLPMAYFGIVNSVAGGLFLAGLMDLMSDNALAIAWSTFVGAELGAWLTATVGGGDMPINHGLLISSGAGWGMVYAALLLGILGSTGNSMRIESALDTLFLATGAGAGLAALATLRYDPTSAQILRADAFGAGVGAAVFVLSALVLGFDFTIATPYVLALLTSAAAMTTVSLLWKEAEPPPARSSAFFYRGPDRDRPYRTVWW
jgi:hypothetical protein